MMSSKRLESEAVTLGPEATALDAADRMDAESVGCIVVVDEAGNAVGIVTDRDLMRRVIAAGRDPAKCELADVMTADPVTVDRGTLMQPLIDEMRSHRVRRLPVMENGRVVAVVSLDDIVLDLAV